MVPRYCNVGFLPCRKGEGKHRLTTECAQRPKNHTLDLSKRNLTCVIIVEARGRAAVLAIVTSAKDLSGVTCLETEQVTAL
jgi:hypothetical protein